MWDGRKKEEDAATTGTFVSFRNTDDYTYDGIAADIRIPLTRTPISGSEQPFWKADTVAVGGIGLPPGSWRVEMPELIIDDTDLMAEFDDGDLFWVDYAYDSAEDEGAGDTSGRIGMHGALADASIYLSQLTTQVLHIVATQADADVTAQETATYTTFEIRVAAGIPGELCPIRVVTGSLVAGTFTVTDVSAQLLVSRSDADLQTFTVSLDANAGDYIGIWGAVPTGGQVDPIISYTNAPVGSNLRADISTLPTVGATYSMSSSSYPLPIFHAY